ncbi:MAG: hypothetical protein MJZ58_03990 [Paludibacteraceae bacterium]|nr:hypothetical protein [Paludibacteraceae bacterium]
MPIRLYCAQEESAFYTLPQGAFVGTITEQGIVDYESSVYIPYSAEGHSWTSTDVQAYSQWYVGSENVCNVKSYTRIMPMNSSYSIPLLRESNKKISYQYGGLEKGVPGTSNKAYVGDSVSHYMTPARLVCDHAQELPENIQVFDLVKTPSYFTKNFDTIGVYFNNIDVMYIEGIRIPITSGIEGETQENLFPQQNSHIKVTIYPAKAISGKTRNIADRSKKIAEVTLTKKDFTAHADHPFTGSLQTALPEPISIEGPFMVELTGMKNSKCNFFFLAARERENENYWGFHLENDKETYHSKFTPAISVKAMFPALFPETGEEKEVIIPAEGATINNAPQRTFYANKRYRKNINGFSHNSSDITWCKIYNINTTNDHVTFAFTADPNTTNTPRQAEFVFSYRGKKLTYNLYQPPMGWTEIREGLVPQDFGTTCLTQEVNGFQGVRLWEIAYRTQDEIVLEESPTLIAGRPYIFEATEQRFLVNYDQGTGIVTQAGSWNGLHGTLEVLRDEALEGKYVMANNQFVRCGSGCELGANRAYMVFEEVPTTPTPAREGVKRIAVKMGAVTGLEFRVESVESIDNSVPHKLYGADGRLYISINGQVIGMDGKRL